MNMYIANSLLFLLFIPFYCIILLILNSFMQKILLSLFIFVAVFLGISHGYADNSITTTNFTIDTRVMDPV